MFGAVWAARLTAELTNVIPGGVPGGDPTASMANIDALPPALQEQVLAAFARAIDTTFLVAVPIMGIAFILALFVPHVTLRKTQEPTPDLEDFDAKALEAEARTVS